MKQELRILMLEDEPLDAELNKAQLLMLEEYNCNVLWVSERLPFIDALTNFSPDIILSDYNLPRYNGLEALSDLKALNLLIPFIFVTGTINEETAAETIKYGAWEYVVKDRLFRLPLAIRSVLKLREERINTFNAALQNRKLSRALEQSPAHIVITNMQGEIEYVNSRFTEVTGFTAEDITGKNISAFLPNNHIDQTTLSLLQSIRNGNSWRGEIQSLKKDGSLLWEYMSVSPLKNEHDVITNYIAVKEDITQRKMMEQQLVEARDRAQQSDKLKEAFLQNLSHEIRTPLNAIVGFSDLLVENQNNPEQIKEFTSIIHSSSQRFLAIINDILSMSRIQTGQETIENKAFQLNTLMDRLYLLFEPLAQAKQLHFTMFKGNIDNSYTIVTDENKLSLILTHLLNNALKFTRYGSIEFGYAIDRDHLAFFVKDTGIGIPPDKQNVIFERFTKSDNSSDKLYGGTGLGLAISKAFASMMGGNISVQSELDSGSVFTLSVPLELHSSLSNTSQSQLDENDSQIPKILIAEDEENNFLLVQAYLMSYKCHIIHARNGLEAVELYQHNKDIKLILMDLKMPEKDGATAMLEIKAINNEIPIIAQTAYALEHEKQIFLKQGFDDYLAKPFKKEELWEKIGRFISLVKT